MTRFRLSKVGLIAVYCFKQKTPLFGFFFTSLIMFLSAFIGVHFFRGGGGGVATSQLLVHTILKAVQTVVN